MSLIRRAVLSAAAVAALVLAPAVAAHADGPVICTSPSPTGTVSCH